MISHLEPSNSIRHVVCHNSDNTFHYVELSPGQILGTGQPFVEVFDTIEEARQAFPTVVPPERTEEIQN